MCKTIYIYLVEAPTPTVETIKTNNIDDDKSDNDNDTYDEDGMYCCLFFKKHSN